ncbi:MULTISPECIES: type II toxin-antitoxin system RelE/ParE family toxin [Thermoactinomyces]|jgi:mRNA-degrading endonuclease RelE of RelBE toxin-antitoxin system|uniref:Type II toxin-antitoxin system RelE/ParE family toxin n=1 Tax=Thermoactinomyces daqus TaxID=1329516 RepID=A0A7W1X8W7_9BACL|nr:MULTISPECIES: type II toxin-antitoxin system RelE/ParE family toxin [Thermoactinomyces]MBA4542139.1 type II toxin-antitoxin system RelE/ParE family toxin [Thermoactinomyces daqus]MBH8598982.1 type II toxin-antitoxin system RelE/ParE family toxin [Thermoactinomyces sp. CICC 10523]MBH8604968.1 type II toxin-antitoxin system RelE/ParE family toxin [Thermoactinomyces sp. CICC 10522]MBH8608408.1 type II toxin-antitoxin system RelE/ParE family toxin [Thermoactinomyces sp. CICC 10521]
MIKEVYHPLFSEDLSLLASMMNKKRFNECLQQIDRAIDQVIRHPFKAAPLKYAPLTGYYKKKFFSVARPRRKQRPDLRLIYRFNPEENTIYFLAVGLRLAQRPQNPHDVYQRARKRNLIDWGE